MSIAFRGVTSRQVKTEGTQTLSLPSGTQAGDEIWLVGVITASGSPSNIEADDFTDLVNDLEGGAARLVVYYRAATADDVTAGIVTITVPSDNAFTGFVVGWTGPVASVVGSTIAFGSSSVTFPSVNLAAAGRVIRLVFGEWNGTGSPISISTPSGHTSRLAADFTLDVWAPGIYDKAQAAAGATGTATATGTNIASMLGITITLQDDAPPNAPILTSPGDGVAIDASQPQTFTWQFSDPDTDDEQTDAEWGYSLNGTDWTTTTDLGTAQQITIPGDTFTSDGATYTWRVRTKDSAGQWGDYATSHFGAGFPPDAPTLTAPAAGDVNFTETATWTYDSDELEFELKRVADDGSGNPDTGTVYATYSGPGGDPAQTSQVVTFDVNGRDEHLLLRTKNTFGLWSPQTDSGVLHVDWIPPPAPVIDSLTPTVTDSVAEIDVAYHTPDATGDEPTADSVDLYLSTDGGTTKIRIATGLPTSGTYVFGFPTSGVDYSFQAVALIADGLSNASSWAS